MTRILSRRITTALVLSTCALAGWAATLSARGDGVNGRAQSATGCSCHSSTPNSSGAVTATISGPVSVAPSSTHTYTISVTGGPAGTTGGFDLAAAKGTLIAGAGTKLLSGDLVHADNTHRTWTFDWTAPATAGADSFYLVGLASNGSGSSGDSWNWYGGVVNTAFVVTVNPLVAVGDEPAEMLWLGPAAPNPTMQSTTVHFSLAEAGPVQITVYDARGARIATIADAEYPSGMHTAMWDGCRDGGMPVHAGWYAIRLQAGRYFRTTPVLRLGR